MINLKTYLITPFKVRFNFFQIQKYVIEKENKKI